MELETSPAKDDDWLIVNVQGTSHTASTNKHISCTICNVLHAVIHIEQFEHLCFPFSLMLYYSTFKSCYYFCLDACFTKQPQLVFRFAQQTVLDGW